MPTLPPQNEPDSADVGDTEISSTKKAGARVSKDWEDVKSRAGEDFSDIKREARHEFDNAREAASGFADDQKNYAADQMESIASAFHRVGDELRSRDTRWVGRYAGDAAERLEGLARRTRLSSVDDLVGDLEKFGRERPAAFLTGAALLGLAASRFLSASESRRSRSSGPSGDSKNPGLSGNGFRNDEPTGGQS